MSAEAEILSYFLKGLTCLFNEPFLVYLSFGFWGKACEKCMHPGTGWEASVQLSSAYAHVQLSPAMGWPTAGGQAVLPWGHSARDIP